MIFIQDLAIIMLVAGMTTVLCHRLRQPVVLGYILAGIIIGPHTPPFPFVTDEPTIKTLAELGVILLMFSLGLEFNLHKLTKVGAAAVIAATLEIVIMIGLGYEIGRFFGWSQMDSIFLGAILSISSTTIIVKALDELRMKKMKFAQLIFGILIVEDIFAVVILTLLSGVATTGTLQVDEVLITIIKLLSFLVVSLLSGILIIPRLLAYIAKFESDEMLLVAVLGLCFGFSLLVVKLDYSVALGAFIIGAIIAESRQLVKIESLINPIRDMFSAIFFVSVGLLFNLSVLVNYIVPIIVISFAVVVGKVVSCALGISITGRDGNTSVKVGMGLAQIGEFSFIIASLGVTLAVTSDFLYSIAVSVSVITTVLTPYLIRYSDTFAGFAAKCLPSSVSSTFSVYSSWMQSIHPDENQAKLKAMMKNSIKYAIIDTFIIIAIFIACAYFAKSSMGNTVIHFTNLYVQKSIIWAIALIASLPFVIAAYRNIKTVSSTLAKFNVDDALEKKFTVKVRKVIAELIPIIAFLSLAALISALSASILPPVELLVIVLMLVIVLAAFLMPWFMRIHSRLKLTLIDVLNKDDK